LRVETNDVLGRKLGVEEAMKKVISEKGLGLFVLAITDILTNNSVVVAVGDQTSAVEKAFDVKLENGQATLEGVVSRKKQIVPQLTSALS